MSRPLYLLHTRPDHRLLLAWAMRRRLVGGQGGDADLGYALHALLHAAFGDQSPQPFVYEGPEHGLLAYTSLNDERIAQAVALAEPDVVDALGLSSSASGSGYRLRSFPTEWAAGHVLGFTVRVRPIQREGRTGKERDAFIGAAQAAPDEALSREAVYVGWLASQLAPRSGAEPGAWYGAAEVMDARLSRFSLTPVMRRTQARTVEARRGLSTVGPDATLSGHLRVVDSAAFAALLARGIGRHRAFGFGMLRLQPARGRD